MKELPSLTRGQIENIRKNPKNQSWLYLTCCCKLSENFIREFQDYINWDDICRNQKLSENFMIEFQDKIDWFLISYHQKLSENFIIEFQDKVSWKNISYQKLSKEFCFEFYDKIYWNLLNNDHEAFKDIPKHIKLYILLNYRDLSNLWKS